MLRREDVPLLQGRGQFLDDVPVDGALHARFVRSPFAHARLDGVDTDAARALPGVVAVYTAADLDLPPLLPRIETPGALPVPRPMLAAERLRFAGEAFALVVAETAYVAEDGADLVDVDADPLPTVADPDRATADDAVAVHEQHGTNVLFERVFESDEFRSELLADAPVVLTRTFRSSRQTALPMEPRGILVQPTDEGLQVWASTQSPHMLARAIAEHLGLAPERVRVVVPDVGGAFGLKAHVYPEEIVVAAAAQRLGRPVKWIEDRADNLTSSCHARDQRVTVTIAADADGRLRAIDADLAVDMGAYGVYAHGHLLEPAGTPSMIPGPYHLPAYRYRTRAIATNKCPLGAYRGVGLPVATFIHERAMDLIAEATGLDRAEVRRRNLIAPHELPFVSLTGQRYDSGDYPAALETALEVIGYADFEKQQQRALEDGRLIGLGIAVYLEYSAVNSKVFAARGMRGLAGFDEAHARLGADGRLQVWTTLPTAGQGLTTTFAQLAADELDLPVEQVTIERVDTSVGDMDGNGTFASRSAVSGGGAIKVVCEELRARLIEDAAELLEVSAADVEISHGMVQVVGAPDTAMPFSTVTASAPEDRYTLTRRHDPPDVVYPYGVHACRVEIDPTTGHVTVDRYVVVEDCGRVINPLVVLGQAHGAVAQGLAGALFESLVYDDACQLQTASLMDYLVPTASEVMPMEVHHMHVPVRASANGSKGVGESGTLAPGAVIANAIGNALAVECNSMPPRPDWLRTNASQRLHARRDGAAEARTAEVDAHAHL